MEKFTIPPCYKYIARNLGNPDERLEYSRNYFANMKKNKVSDEDSIALYCSNAVSESAGHILSVNGVSLQADEYFEHVNGMEEFAILTCQKYYKERLKPTSKNNVCVICPFSKTYANEGYLDECALFKYLISDVKNFAEFQKIGLPEHFRYVVDIASELRSNEPALVPILRIAYEQLSVLFDEVFACAEISERLEYLVGRITASAASNPNVANLQKKNNKAMPIAWSAVCADILSSKTLKYDTVCQIVSRIDLNISKKSKPKKKKGSAATTPSLFDYIDNMGVPAEAPVKENPPVEEPPVMFGGDIEVDDIDIPESALMGSDAVGLEDAEIAENSTEPENISEDYSDTDVTQDATDGDVVGEPMDMASEESAPVPPEDQTQDNDGELPFGPVELETEQSASGDNSSNDLDEQANEQVTESVDAEQTHVETSDAVEPPVEQSASAKAKAEPSVSLRFTVPPLPDDSHIYRITVNPATFRYYALSYAKNENSVFQSILTSKVLPLEVIHNNSGAAYLLIFIRSHGKFYQLRIDSNMPKTIRAVMSSKSVTKICYQPYYLYSLMRVNGIRVCNVHSLCSMDMLLHPDAPMCLYDDFFKIYDEKFDVVEADSGYADFDSLLMNMQRYIQVDALQMRAKYSKSELEKRLARDEVLGTSFLRAVNLKTNDYLFDEDVNGKLLFNDVYDLSATKDGFFVNYSLGVDDVPDVKREDIYLDSLIELARKGRIYKYNIQLVAMSATSMVLFIGEGEYELITTTLQKFFNRYALRHGLEKFALHAAHQRIYVNTQKKAKKKLIPSTYGAALDMLVTTNDSVQVKASHIVSRPKNGEAKRKKQTKEYVPDKKPGKK